MSEWFTLILLLIGAFLMMLAGVGVVRMPDTFLRMSATAKAGTLGVGLIAAGAAIYFNAFSVSTRAIAIIFFLFITTPVAAHMLGRASYFDGIPLWKGTVQDDLRGHYNRATHSLESEFVPRSDRVPPVDEADDYE